MGQETLPYQTHSPTSFAAAQAKTDAATQRAEVLAWFRVRGEHGATDEECQMAMGLAGSSQRPRRVELVNRGLLVDTGTTRKTMAGRTAAVWRAKA